MSFHEFFALCVEMLCIVANFSIRYSGTVMHAQYFLTIPPNLRATPTN